MSKLSKKQLQERMDKLKAFARAEIAKTEVMHFRLDQHSIEQLYKAAGQRKKPVGALIREWVLEKLQSEFSSQDKTTTSLLDVTKRLHVIEKHLNISTANSR